MLNNDDRKIAVNIEETMKSAFIDYAMSVIVGRALPDVRDGLKPVHRRILFGMNQMGLAFNRPYRKSAKVVGEVMGNYHPHGDQAIYDTLVRMAQIFPSGIICCGLTARVIMDRSMATRRRPCGIPRCVCRVLPQKCYGISIKKR